VQALQIVSRHMTDAIETSFAGDLLK